MIRSGRSVGYLDQGGYIYNFESSEYQNPMYNKTLRKMTVKKIEFVVNTLNIAQDIADSMFVFNIIFYTVTSFRLNNLLFTNYVTTTCSSDYSRSFSSGVEVTTSKRQPEIVF